MAWLAALAVLGILWRPLVRYLVPRFCLVTGGSMLPTLCDGDVVLGMKPHPSAPLKTGGVYVYRLPLDRKRWVIKRLAFVEDGKCFFVGDNSDGSADSRDYGLIDRKDVLFEVVWHTGFKGKGR